MAKNPEIRGTHKISDHKLDLINQRYYLELSFKLIHLSFICVHNCGLKMKSPELPNDFSLILIHVIRHQI